MADDEQTVLATGQASSARGREKVHHTVTACVRCRQVSPLATSIRSHTKRDSEKHDVTLPYRGCEPCERSNSHCEYFDSTKNTTISRTYITSLQETVRKLNEELKRLEKEDDFEPDHESMARAPGLVKFNERDDSRYLGPSSGIAITRYVMEFARQNATRRTIRDIVPDDAAQEIKQKFDAESAKPTSKVYPLISSVAAPTMPHNRGLMDQLVDIYMVKAQYMLPLLHEPTFRRHVDLVYDGETDATLNFQVRMVTAISMQKLDTQYAGLADSYYLAALPFLTDAVRKMDLSTLQCFALIAQYSLLTPTRTAAYWVVGLAAKLCAELGLNEEQTIEKPPSGNRPNFLEIDMRRRLFWIITSMEYGLSHSLGRPSAFGVTVDNINVRFFEQCDDRFITPDGLLPGHHPIMQKCIAIHFFKMRLLQAEIRRTMYLKKRETPVNDQDPWFLTMLSRIDDWVRDCPKNDEGSGLSQEWFHGRRNTMVIFMYRPSPQIPTPSLNAAQRCYDAAVFNIMLQKKQAEDRLIDITWIFTQAIFMALNTVLWSLSYIGIRQMHSIEEVRMNIDNALRAIELCADRWPGVRSAQQLYGNLIHGCLRAYENDKLVTSPGVEETAQFSMQDVSSSTSQTAQSPSSTAGTSYYGPQSPQSFAGSVPSMVSHTLSNKSGGAFDTSAVLHQQPDYMSSNNGQNHSQFVTTMPPVLNQLQAFGSSTYENLPRHVSSFPGASQSLPSWDATSAAALNSGYAAFSGLSVDNQPWLAQFGDEYPQSMGQSYIPMPFQMQSLNEQDQCDLMASLERSQLPDVSGLISESNTFYTAHFP